LISFLNDKNYQVRVDAVKALGQVRSIKAVPVLVRMLANPESGIRSTVVEALGEIGATEAAPYLARVLADSSLNVRIETVWALEKLGWRPKTPEEKVRYCIAKEQWNDLSRIGMESIPALIHALPDDHAHVRTRITEVLAGLGAPAVRALEQVKKEGKPELRALADETLAAIRKKTGANGGRVEAGGRNSVDWLLSDQESEEGRTTGEAAGGRRDTLDEAAPESPRQKVARISAVLRDPDAAIRVAAVEALRVIGMPAEKTLIRILNDGHKSVRSAAAEALGSLKSTVAVPYLIRLLRTDPKKEVRRAAAESLGLIEDAYAIPALIRGFRDRDPLVRSGAASALGRMGSAARDPVLAVIRDPNALLRGSALLALGSLKDPDVLLYLVIRLSDPNPAVRGAAQMPSPAFSACS
ncbi:HEAT repeat domain-containing protein, partial [Methanoregula sp.]|uniref:HEAT repeat domain-containing protein n=1 Tax=Methanoregula sp. TaxID=2052170 RepID=UPI000CC95774